MIEKIDEVRKRREELLQMLEDILKKNGVRIEGKRQGVYKKRWYYNNGQLKFEANCKDGEIDGLIKHWHRNGQLKSKLNSKNNKRHGLYEAWHENGQINKRAIYKDGEKHGLYEEWDKYGKKLEEHYYIKDEEVRKDIWDEFEGKKDRKMRIYLVTRTDKYDYDEYISAVVIENTLKKAMEYCELKYDFNKDDMTCELIGTATSKQKRGEVLSSFNAG